MRCFACKTPFKSLVGLEDDPMTLNGGISFVASGNYGSTVYDPMDSRKAITIGICDACLVAGASDVTEVYTSTSVTRAFHPWNPPKLEDLEAQEGPFNA